MREAELERLNAKLTAVREVAQGRLRKADYTAFVEALDRFYSKTSPEEVVERDSEEIYGATLALWKFAARRRPGEAKARLYNPRMSEHGWESPHSVLEIVNDDMPFLVDSLTTLLTERGTVIHALMHPIVSVTRDAQGNLKGFAERDAKGSLRESMIQVQIDQIGDDARLGRLEDDVREMLNEVRAATEDWKAMLGKLAEVSEALRREAPKGAAEATDEACEFLDWLAADHFTFLGYRQYGLRDQGEGKRGASEVVKDSGLGLMRDAAFTVLRDADGNPADWSPDMDAFVTDVSPLLIIKANRRSTVHRRAHLDLIGVKRYDKKGKVIGQHVFIGLFTSAAYNRSPRQMPLLREKVERVIARAGFSPGSHDGKALTNVLETYPRDELLQSSEDQLYHNALGVLHLATRPRTRLFVRPDRFGRFMSCLVYVPRERYNTELRVKLGRILSEAFDGRVSQWTPAFGEDAPLARVHFVIGTRPGGVPDYDLSEIEERIVGAVRSWTDQLREALVDRKGEHQGNRLHTRYGDGFPIGYRDMFHAGAAIDDIEKMEELTAESPLGIKFYRRLEDPESAVRFKIYHVGRSLPLSDCLPVLEHMGFRILEEHPFEVQRGEDDEIWLHDFLMDTVGGREVDLGEVREKLENAFVAVWTGEVDDDRLNRLVVLAGLSARQTALLRAISRFLRQARIPYSVEYMEDALADNPAIAKDLVKLFSARFDPARGDGAARKTKAERVWQRIETALDQVASLDVDRILRRFRNAIDSMLRTNYYQPGADGRPKAYLSFKLDSGKLEELPLPRPWREIFVYATWVEGVHLRGGPVARGGLRWSDRKEDYRTEVLGLVKAQIVKNAVIVPVGSKGGFLPKRLPVGGTRDEIQAEAIRCYKTFLSGLLDITDNLDGSDVVPPKDVVRDDGDDPYLVVAADKGTATFSDIANGLAREYGFWLDDAFASGGSNGYDHKGMGITAKGAWEAVKRHFRELGTDIQTQPFTAIGVGDMSGDVFGNGMLLSEQTRLLAAFDHRDIFVDPNPDPAKSIKERARLFGLGRSSWQDYDTKLISKGGGVFSRAAKSIALTPEIKQLTGLKADKVTPFELMQAILRMQADLLWFGGIGTYVKSSEETHLDVGDRGNDAIRVDAPQLRVKVIGEGANLGVTQRGRIEAGLHGVKLNTDAVDNSGGVDCSDHEVNIKIALGQVVSAGDMTEKQRNNLLAKMTDEVAELVLKTNYHQTLAISLVEARAPQSLEEHARFMRWLEHRGVLNREVELLPDEEEIAERARAGQGLTRPEIAVLVAYAKIDIFSDLAASGVPDDPWMERLLFDYMPGPVRTKYQEAVRGHRLRREIIATVAANAMVNQAGPSLYFRLREETGATAAESVRAFIIARETFGLREIAADINALDNKVPAPTQLEMHLALNDLLSAQSQRLVQGGQRNIGEAIEFFRPGVEQIAATADATITAYSKKRLGQRTTELEKAKAPKKLAQQVAALELLGGAIDVIEKASVLERKVSDVAANYFATGARFELDWLRSLARRVRPADHWERIALGRLMSDLRAQQSAIGAAALTLSRAKAGTSSVAKWAEANSEVTDRADRLITELKAGGPLSVAKLAVAASLFRAVSTD